MESKKFEGMIQRAAMALVIAAKLLPLCVSDDGAAAEEPFMSSLSSPLSEQDAGGSSAECRVTVTLRFSDTAG